MSDKPEQQEGKSPEQGDVERTSSPGNAGLMTIACPGCKEVYEVAVPETNEERSITLCPFCEQKFYVRHEKIPGKAKKEGDGVKTSLQESPASLPKKDVAQPFAPAADPKQVVQPQGTQRTLPTQVRAPSAPGAERRKAPPPPTRESTSLLENPTIAGLLAATITLLKHLPFIIIPVVGAIYLLTLRTYESGKAGARAFLGKNPGSFKQARGIGLLFGLLIAGFLIGLIYFIFSMLAVEVFFGFYELLIFCSLFIIPVFFSALGGAAAIEQD